MFFPIHSDARFSLTTEAAEAFGLNPAGNVDDAWYCDAVQIEAVEINENGILLVFPENSELGGAILPFSAIDLEKTARIHGDAYSLLLWAIFNAMDLDAIVLHFAEWATVGGIRYDAISFDLHTGNGEELVVRRDSYQPYKTWDEIDALDWTPAALLDLLGEMAAAIEANQQAA
jgi:hypothetical protein